MPAFIQQSKIESAARNCSESGMNNPSHNYNYIHYDGNNLSSSTAFAYGSGVSGIDSRLYSSERFSPGGISSTAAPRSQVSEDQKLSSLTSSLDGILSKIEAIKEVHAVQQLAPPRPMSKKNMDLSSFPMVNLANNSIVNGIAMKQNFSKPSQKIEQRVKPSELYSSTEDKKAVSPPSQAVYQNFGAYNSLNAIKLSKESSWEQSSGSYGSSYTSQKSSKSGNISINGRCESSNNGEEQTYGFANILKSPKKAPSFQEQLRQKQEAYAVKVNHVENKNQNEAYPSQNAFVKSQFNAKNLLQTGLLSMPNLKVSMEIKDEYSDSGSPYQQYGQMQLQKIIKKQTNQQYLPKKSVIFNQVNLGQFELGKCVGSGKFGDVHICRHKATGAMFALKKIFKSTITQYDMINQFTRELKIHYRLDHPNIIKLYTHFDDEYHIFLLMEYAEGGILMDRMRCTEQVASQYVEQTIEAVQYLHKMKIAHRDIKPQNIVLQFNSTIKLCDFGWASYYDNEMKTTFCGTLDYLSPEMKEKGQYDNSVDIWSVGVLTFQLLTGVPPYRKELTTSMKNGFSNKQDKKTNWAVNYPSFLSPLAQSFIRNLLKENPEERATLRFCSTHTFIRKYHTELDQLSYYDDFCHTLQ